MMNSNSNEPMSEERLAEIRSRWSMGVVFGTDNYVLTARNYADIGDLLTEVLRLRLREAEYEKQRADYHHIVSELARCEHDHDALLHENDALRSKLAGADQRASRYSEELVIALDAGKRIREEAGQLRAEAQEGSEALIRTHRLLSRTVAREAALMEIAEAVASPWKLDHDALKALSAKARALLAQQQDGEERGQ